MDNYPEYLERNTLIERIEKAYCDGCENYNGVRCRACGIGDAIDVVEDAPTALERTAEWIAQDDTFTRFECSRCHTKKSSYTLELLPELWSENGERAWLTRSGIQQANRHESERSLCCLRLRQRGTIKMEKCCKESRQQRTFLAVTQTVSSGTR